jgi:hypothetical protein
MSISRYPDFEETIAVDTTQGAAAQRMPRRPMQDGAHAVTDPRDLGLDLDADGHLWQPAPTAMMVRPMAVVLVLLAATLGILFGPDVALWFALR